MTANPRGVVCIIAATALLLAALYLYLGYHKGDVLLPWQARVPEHDFPRALPQPERGEGE